MTLDHLLLAIFWITYGILHSTLAGIGLKNNIKTSFPGFFKYYRLAYNIIAFLGLGLILWFQLTMQSIEIFSTTQITIVFGALITTAGLCIMVICIKKYFLSLSGLLGLWKEKKKSELIISGVHRYVRHPLYFGTFLFIWGLLLLLPMLSLLISNLIITLYTLIGIRLEEQKLVLDFGEQYKRYKETVPKIIPRLQISENSMHHHRQKNSIDR